MGVSNIGVAEVGLSEVGTSRFGPSTWFGGVVAAAFLGALIVLMAPTPRADAQTQVLDSYVILVDVSGSMNFSSNADPTRSRLEVAQEALTDAVSDVAPGSINLGLRSFSGCSATRSELLVPVAPADPDLIIAEISSLTTGGSTGIETALRDAVADLPADSGRHVVLLISDGAETCGGDPCGAMVDIVASGVNVVVNTVGFQTAGTAAEPQLACIANATGGTSVSAVDGEELFDEITSVIQQCTVELILCYAPEIRFHPGEGYFPMDPTTFVDGSELRWAADTFCGDRTVGGSNELTVTSLNNYSWFEISNGLCRLRQDEGRFHATDYTRPNFKNKDPAANGTPRASNNEGQVLPDAEGFFLNTVMPDKPTGAVPVNNVVDAPAYVIDRGGQIEYWFFYGYDPKSDFDITNPPPGNVPPVLSMIDGALAHEGDWERIIVTLDADDTPTQVTFFGHGCAPIVTPWADVERSNGTHPVVYPAEGSHASYPYERAAGASWDADPTCGSGQSGRTDSTVYDPLTSGVWQTWNGIGLIDPGTQPWYGFGGAWGNTGSVPFFRGDGTGPSGLPFQGTGTGAITRAPSQAGVLEVPDKIDFQWLEPGEFTFVDGLPGQNFVVIIETLPQVIANGTYDASGTANGSFVIPEGTSPGLHTITIRNADTGEMLGGYPIWVLVPDGCTAPDAGPDIDGDELTDACDPRPLDGPLADFDGDGIANSTDNCPTMANADQAVEGTRTVGIACNSVAGINPVPSFPVVLAQAVQPTPTPIPVPPTALPPTPTAVPSTALPPTPTAVPSTAVPATPPPATLPPATPTAIVEAQPTVQPTPVVSAVNCAADATPTDTDGDGFPDQCILTPAPSPVPVTCQPGETATDADNDGVRDTCLAALVIEPPVAPIDYGFDDNIPTNPAGSQAAASTGPIIALTGSESGPVTMKALMLIAVGAMMVALATSVLRRARLEPALITGATLQPRGPIAAPTPPSPVMAFGRTSIAAPLVNEPSGDPGAATAVEIARPVEPVGLELTDVTDDTEPSLSVPRYLDEDIEASTNPEPSAPIEDALLAKATDAFDVLLDKINSWDDTL